MPGPTRQPKKFHFPVVVILIVILAWLVYIQCNTQLIIKITTLKHNALQFLSNTTEFINKTGNRPIISVIDAAAVMVGIDNTKQRKLNVLLIVADDLRPQLNMYQGEYNPNPDIDFTMHTPSLDRLAERSLVFTRAYAQFSVCGPSRASFLTGRRPDTTQVWDLVTYWRKTTGNFTTIPQYYKDQGYTSVSLGKIFHPGPSSGFDDPISWSDEPFHGQYKLFYQKKRNSWEAIPRLERQEKPLPDEEVTAKARSRLRTLAPKAHTGEQPFFMAVGFHKPHLPFVCPEEDFEYYPLNTLKIPTNLDFPMKFPDIHWIHPEPGHFKDLKHNNCSMKHTQMYCKLPDKYAPELRRAYFACISYVDRMVGELLEELEVLGLTGSTIVAFLGDHGYHLGENGMYGKHTNMEQSTHVPFMLSIPGQTDNGMVSNSFVELVDLFPTLVEASGLGPLPVCPQNSTDIDLCIEGVTLMPLVEDPTLKVKNFTVSQMLRYQSMGYSIRTDKYRYNEWPVIPTLNGETHNLPQKNDLFWVDLHDRELYDHTRDNEEVENLADNPLYAGLVRELGDKLHMAVGK